MHSRLWLYAKDPATGAPVLDPVSREQVFSSEGERFRELYETTSGMGVGSVADRITVAKALYDQNRQRVEAQPQERRQEQSNAVEERRNEMRGKRNTNRPPQRAVNNVSPGTGETDAGEQQRSIGEHFLHEILSS